MILYARMLNKHTDKHMVCLYILSPYHTFASLYPTTQSVTESVLNSK
jgi:hypothetical protein